MRFLRRLFRRRAKINIKLDPNPNRTGELYTLTPEGYIIAQDTVCQYEYAREQRCPHCRGKLEIVAQINRESQGLNELVCKCRRCKRITSFIFDVSNEVYQTWLAEQFGSLYVPTYEGPPRQPRR